MSAIRKLGSAEEAKEVFQDAFEGVASNANAWIAMIGFPDGKGVVVKRVTFNFPQERFLDVVAELRKSLIEELHGGLLPDAPLPRVTPAMMSDNPPPALPTVSMSDVRYADGVEDVAKDTADSGEQE